MATIKAKTKSEYSRIEAEITEEISRLLKGFSEEELEMGIIVTGRPPEAGSRSIVDLKGAYLAALIEGTIAG